MHCGEIEMLPLSLAWKLGLHPSTLVCINCSSSNLPKWPPPSLACLCSQIIPFIIMILYSWGSHDLHNLPWISYILLVKDVRAGIGFLEEGSTTRDICVDPTTILLCRNNTAPILKTEFLECRTKFLPYDYFYASFVLILCPSPDSHQDLNIFNFSQHNPQKNFDNLSTVITMGRWQFTWPVCLVCCERQDSRYISVLMRLEYFLSQQQNHCL
jgi:hypothetical protein